MIAATGLAQAACAVTARASRRHPACRAWLAEPCRHCHPVADKIKDCCWVL